MRIHAVVADTGRPVAGGPALNLLNAGWTATMAAPLVDGGYTLPGQALAVFIEAPWAVLNRPHRVVVQLVDDEGILAELAGPDGMTPARIEHEITIPPVPTAPNGTPGYTTLMMDLPLGSLRIPAPRRRYTWRVTIGEHEGYVGFWVLAPPTAPQVGGGRPNLPS